MFRILTENKNAEFIKNLLARRHIDYTMFDCEGSWKGLREKSILIELDGASREVAEAVAKFIKDANIQQAVLIQEVPVKSRMI